jgi:hypothetical protein
MVVNVLNGKVETQAETKRTAGMTAVRDNLYLDLMKKALLASIYEENGWYVLGSLGGVASFKGWLQSLIVKLAWTGFCSSNQGWSMPIAGDFSLTR